MHDATSNFLRYREGGDVAALGAVFDAVAPRLSSLALHLCGDPADAEDAVQNTFLVAIGKATAFDAARPLMPWLCGVLEGEVRNLQRSRRRRRQTPLVDVGDRADDGVGPLALSERHELVEVLRTHVAALPGDLRQVMLLRLQHGLAPVEVAEVLGVSPGTVRMRLHRGLEALRRLLPASLGVLLASMMTTRGLAAVRTVVLGAASGHAVAVVGGAMLKKILMAVAVGVVMAIGWFVLTPAGVDASTPSRDDGAVAAAVGALPAAAQAGTPAVESVAIERRRAPEVIPGAAVVVDGAAADAVGALQLRIVAYERGDAMPGATVLVVREAGGLGARRSVTVDALGQALVRDLVPGKYHVHAHCGGQRSVEIQAGQTTSVEFDIMVGNPVRGLVVLPDGRPAAQAQIVLCTEGDLFDGGRTGPDGRFALNAVYPFFLVGACHEGYAPSGLHELAHEGELRIELPSVAAVIAGRVVDGDGRGVANACLQVRGEQQPERWRDAAGHVVVRGGDHERGVAADGSFRIEAGAGPVRLLVQAPGFAPWQGLASARVGEEVVLPVVLQRRPAERGIVVDEAGVPIVGVQVQLGGTNGPATQSGDDGRFTFAAVPDDAAFVDCRAEAIEPLRAMRADACGADGEWRVVARRCPLLRLCFVDERNAPLHGWLVRCEQAGGVPTAIGEDGRAVVRTVREGRKRLELWRRKSEFRFVPWPVDASATAETVVTVDLSAAQQAIVRGRVVGSDGAPVTNIRLRLATTDGTMMAVAHEDGGSFELAMPAAEAVLCVDGVGHGPSPRFVIPRVAAGEVRDLGTLRLPPFGRLLVRTLLPGGVPVAGLTLRAAAVGGATAATEPAEPATTATAFVRQVDVDGWPWDDGEEQPWPAGTYEYRLECDNAMPVRGTFTVVAGQQTVVEQVLVPARARVVRLPDPVPDWGQPAFVDYELFAPNGELVARGRRVRAAGLTADLSVPVCPGRWRLVLRLDDGRSYGGEVRVLDSDDPASVLRVAVAPLR